MRKVYDPGSIIQNRGRLWRVNRDVDDVVYATPLDGFTEYEEKFFKPVEQISDGKVSSPSSDIVGNAAVQRMLITAFKLDLIYGTAPLISLKKSRVIPTPYQLVPVVMALDMPRVRMLLADDVGSGKTIEAGLILTELMSRNRAGKILFITPASLRDQWQSEMDYFFHMNPQIISRRHQRALERSLPPGTNPWEYYDKLIVSMDYAKRDEVKAQIESQSWDLILVDEAHKVAKPHQSSGSYKVDMRRWKLMDELKDKCRHLLLLTATPHNGYTDSFASLLHLLDVNALDGGLVEPVIHRDVAGKHVCQRRRKDIVDWMKKAGESVFPFPERNQDEIIVDLTSVEREVVDLLDSFTSFMHKNLNGASSHGQRLGKWTIMHFHKRALSSPESLRRSLKKRIEKLEGILKDIDMFEDEQQNPGITGDEARAVTIDEDPGEDLSEEEAGERLEKMVFIDREKIEDELHHLIAVYGKAKSVKRGDDSKLQRLIQLLEDRLKIKPKIIIFTKWTDTQDYLVDCLSSRKMFDRYDKFKLSGLMSEGQRKEVFTSFEECTHGILVATDCISEGLNLQYSCSQMVHYELPWNPNRLEQRNGRIDRFGQNESEVFIRSMVMNDTLDAIVLKVLVEKAYRIKKDRGFSPPFFGDETSILDLINQQDLDISIKTQTSLLDYMKDEEAKKEKITDVTDPFSEETIDQIDMDSFYGSGLIDFGDIHRRMEETKKRIGDEKTLERFVLACVKFFGYQVSKDASDLYTFIPSVSSAQYKGIIGQHFEKVTFNPVRAATDPRLDLMDISHPLVRQMIEIIKQGAFNEKDQRLYGRTAFWESDNVDEVMILQHLLVRFSVDTDPITFLEEIIPLGFPLYADEDEVDGKSMQSEETEVLFQMDMRPLQRTEEELLEDLSSASKLDFHRFYEHAAEKRRQELIKQRQEFISHFGEDQPEWSKGMLQVQVASIDHLTTTILYPEVKS
jgi:ERCC4-related helicase